MNKSYLLKICKLLLITNIVFWLIVALYFSLSRFGASYYLVIKILLFLESILYLISLVGILKRIKMIYLLSILLAFGNTFLSVTDQVGTFDIASLILSGLTFLSLVSIRSYIYKK